MALVAIARLGYGSNLKGYTETGARLLDTKTTKIADVMYVDMIDLLKNSVLKIENIKRKNGIFKWASIQSKKGITSKLVKGGDVPTYQKTDRYNMNLSDGSGDIYPIYNTLSGNLYNDKWTVISIIDNNNIVVSDGRGRVSIQSINDILQSEQSITNIRIYERTSDKTRRIEEQYNLETIDKQVNVINNRLRIMQAPYMMTHCNVAVITNAYAPNIFIAEGVEYIHRPNIHYPDNWTFNRHIDNVYLLSTLHRIPEELFLCAYIKQIKIMPGIQEIGESAFLSSTINELVIPKSVTKLERHAFGGATINKMIIEGNGTVIDKLAFDRAVINKVIIKGNGTDIAKLEVDRAQINWLIKPRRLRITGKDLMIGNITDI